MKVRHDEDGPYLDLNPDRLHAWATEAVELLERAGLVVERPEQGMYAVDADGVFGEEVVVLAFGHHALTIPAVEAARSVVRGKTNLAS